MESKNQESIFKNIQMAIIILFLAVVLISLLFFKNNFFKSTLILKSFGKLSVDPEIALSNDKPTFLEFYAEWCEICKEMAQEVSALKEDYGKDINFVFLNVDNPKWERYIRKYDVNGIPQVNLIDNTGNIISTFIGRQEQKTLIESIENLHGHTKTNNLIFDSGISKMKKNNSFQVTPRSHG